MVDIDKCAKLSFICAETCQSCVIPRERSDRGNLIELRTGVSYGCRIWFTQYIEIATPPSAVRNDTCDVYRCYTAKLSFCAKMIDAQARLLLEEKLSKIFDF